MIERTGEGGMRGCGVALASPLRELKRLFLYLDLDYFI
jgi:hypothetical protein